MVLYMLDAKINTLLAVAETNNFTRAAQILSLTQPAVSHHISLLEQELGAPLFVRCRGRAQLTREGEIAVRYARRMKGLYEKMQAEQNEKIASDRKSQVGTGDRSERIRTYNFPQGRVTDHRIGLTLYKILQIMDGDLDELIDALITTDRAEKLAASEENE